MRRGRFIQRNYAGASNHVTTVDMATGQVLRVAEGHTPAEVRRMVKAAERQRSSLLRAASITSWHMSTVGLGTIKPRRLGGWL